MAATLVVAIGFICKCCGAPKPPDSYGPMDLPSLAESIKIEREKLMGRIRTELRQKHNAVK